jgi:hypothetical protein
MEHRKVRLSAVLSLLLAASMILTGTQNALAYGAEGSDPGSVHEGLVENAVNMNVYQGAEAHAEMLTYLETIKNGAWHEDQIDIIWDDGGACLTQSHFWDGDLM